MGTPMLSRPQDTLIPAPITFKLWQTVIAHFKAVGLPDMIGRKSLVGLVPANLRYRTRLSLRALKLITDDGRVLRPFQQLVTTWNTPFWQPTLKNLAREAYPYLADIDLRALDSAKLRKAFVLHVGRDSAILAKSEMFFLNLASAAGLELSDALQKRVTASEAKTTDKPKDAVQPMKTASPTAKTLRSFKKGEAPKGKGATPAKQTSRRVVYVDTNAVITAATQLLGRLPPFDPAWPEEAKIRWLESYSQLTTTLTKNSIVDDEIK
jgi:hypothetical protein